MDKSDESNDVSNEVSRDVSRYDWFLSRPPVFDAIYRDVPEYSDPDFFRKLIDAFGNGYIKNGAIVLPDTQSEYFNYKNGSRVTSDVPEHPENRIYILGDSHVVNYWMPDRYTAASVLQRICNRYARKRYEVMSLALGGSRAFNNYLRFKTLSLEPGDVVIHWGAYLEAARGSRCVDYALRIYGACAKKGAHFAVVRQPSLNRLPNPTQYERALLDLSYRDILAGATPPPPKAKRAPYCEPDCFPLLRAVDCPCIDMQPHFDGPHGLGEIFIDNFGHMGPAAVAREMEIFYGSFLAPLQESPCLDAARPLAPVMKRFLDQATDHCDQTSLVHLKCHCAKANKYNASIKKWMARVPKAGFAEKPRIGCIVMNCNPFTLGHQFLIETVCKRVDGLYIFVVEEDRSVFPFKARLEMVRRGVAHLGGKVVVAGSGKFIISSLSFPEYFAKETEHVAIDASADLTVFAAVIAPKFGIKTRFVGEEPRCMVTRQYNELMLKLLPPMGVGVQVIPRKTAGDGVTPISASLVRQYLKEGDREALRLIIPQTTLDYLESDSFAAVKIEK